MSDDDELFKNIIGEELWEELNSIEDDQIAYEEAGKVARQIVALNQEQTEKLKTQTFYLPTDEFPVEFQGADAFELLATVGHASETNCPDCIAELIEFVGALTGLMLWKMIADQNLKDNDE